MQLSQLEAMHRQVEAHRNKKKVIELRNKWMQAKTVKNYQSEYDRIRNHMSNTSIPYRTTPEIENRKAVLEKLGAKAFDGIKN
jgi:uncharacterized protein (DUF111 family)